MNGNDRSITRFTMLAHGVFHMYELSIPVFVGAWLGEFGTSPAVIGIVVGVGYALVGLGALPGGFLADTYGSRRLVVAAIVGMSGGFAVVAVAPTLPVVATGLILWGTAASVYHPAALALLSRGVEERGRGFAYHGAAGNVGTVVGPLGVAVGLTFFEWRTVAAMLVVPALVGVGFSRRVSFDETANVDEADSFDQGVAVAARTDRLREHIRKGQTLLTGGFALVFTIIICYGLYYRGVFTFLPDILSGLTIFTPVEVRRWTVDPGQYVYAGLLLVGVVGQYAGGRLIDEYDTVGLLGGSFLALVVISLLFVPASNVGLLPLLVVCGLLGFLVYVVAPIYQATVAEYVPPEIRGTSYGVTYLGVFGVGALGAVAAGSVLTWGRPAVLFALLAAIAGLAVLLTAALRIEYP